MPGVVDLPYQGGVEIYPLGVAGFDQFEFPLPPPSLDRLFALDGAFDVGVNLEPNEACAAVATRETR